MLETRAMTRNEICEEIFWKSSNGLTSYPEALAFMEQRARDIHQRGTAPMVWLVEHPPVFTAGTSAKDADLYNPHDYPTYAAGRGGQWTYHGPGQRLGYVMLDLTRQNGTVPPRDVRSFVAGLEGWMIDSLARLGVTAFTREGRIGVWTIDPLSGLEAKIGALGIRVSRWVSWHGVSLNVSPDLNDFDGIVPCGIREFGVTSLQRFDSSLTMKDLDDALALSWPERFGTIPQAV